MTPTLTRRPSLFPFPGARLIAVALLPLALAACNGGSDADEPAAQPAPVPRRRRRQAGNTGKEPGVPEGEAGRCDQGPYRRAESHAGRHRLRPDLLQAGPLARRFRPSTWAGDTANQIDYLNRTVGKKFDDYCEDTGAGKRAQPRQHCPGAGGAAGQAGDLQLPERAGRGRHRAEDRGGGLGRQAVSHRRSSQLLGAARDLRRRAQAAGVGQGRRQL